MLNFFSRRRKRKHVEYGSHGEVISCLFCDIIAGKSPGRIVFENDKYSVFHTIKPGASVHLLVCPKIHIPDINGLSGTLGTEIVRDMTMVGETAAKVINMEIAQICFHVPPHTSVDHLHMHVLCGSISVYGQHKYNTSDHSLCLLAERLQHQLTKEGIRLNNRAMTTKSGLQDIALFKYSSCIFSKQRAELWLVKCAGAHAAFAAEESHMSTFILTSQDNSHCSDESDWRNKLPAECVKCLQMDVPRTIPRTPPCTIATGDDCNCVGEYSTQNSSLIRPLSPDFYCFSILPTSELDIVAHHQSIMTVTGLSLAHVMEAGGDGSYVSGLTFMTSFLLMVTDGDKDTSFVLLTHVLQRYSFLLFRSVINAPGFFSNLYRVLGIEFPKLSSALENKFGIDLKVFCSEFYILLFAYNSMVPYEYTVHCWDYILSCDCCDGCGSVSVNPPAAIDILVVALLGANEQLVMSCVDEGELLHSRHTLFNVVEQAEVSKRYKMILNRLHLKYIAR